MRKAVLVTIALVALAFIAAPRPALSFSVRIGGTHSADEIRKTCDRNGGEFDTDERTGGYACTGRKGTVFCDKDGNCEGRCSKCGGVATRTTVGGILAGPSGSETRPLASSPILRKNRR